MLGIQVERAGDKLILVWQLSRIEIPVAEIREVAEDPTYGGEDPAAIRIGAAYGTTDRIVIRTDTRTYLLFTTNGNSIRKRIETLIATR
ncbi:hypothetical protein F4V43_15950 [Paenibacillus spiritus]|uniref:Sublancin immunity protein SunI-like PH domain-containing protein n=1 Tax=Paenibacillus spiritus TaxID=2496557 RepID=A0A5J5FZR1_9BACL|nr:hypothetical protein [Paenibacillus spiritus]KAA8999812.1 hypothetical protein F4V43_15950 [Paenibacillus spiritus]